MPNKILALDVGGTNIKSGLVVADGSITELPMQPVDSSQNASVDEFMSALAVVVEKASGDFDGLGICFPGPFDYRNGISLMTHKFPSLNGVKLVDALKSGVPVLEDVPVKFCHDANAFLAGEMWKGAANEFTRAMGVTLGTGIGVAYCDDDGLLVNELGSPAARVSVWSRKYKIGIVEDFISSRALVEKYGKAVPGYEGASGVLGIAEAAVEGDGLARGIFEEFGSDLAMVLSEPIFDLEPEVVVLGGQLSKSMSLFVPSMLKSMERIDGCAKVKVCSSGLGGKAALLGVASLFLSRDCGLDIF